MAADELQLLPASILPSLAQAATLVVFTQAARALLTSAFASSNLTLPPVSVIPHGVDTQTFHPVPRTEARAALFPDLDPAAFLLLNANRNQPYKRIDLTLEGFSLFATGKPANVMLCLHMASRPRPQSTPAWVDRLGIRERILPSQPVSSTHPHLADSDLNLIYSACDVGINTSDREGWGLIAFEHAATRAPQILPALPALAELWHDAGILLPTSDAPSPQLPGRIAPAVTPESIAQTLQLLYTEPDLRDRYAAAALDNARNPRLDWNVIAAQWTSIILGLLP